jgi:hypothetical protein
MGERIDFADLGYTRASRVESSAEIFEQWSSLLWKDHTRGSSRSSSSSRGSDTSLPPPPVVVVPHVSSLPAHCDTSLRVAADERLDIIHYAGVAAHANILNNVKAGLALLDEYSLLLSLLICFM